MARSLGVTPLGDEGIEALLASCSLPKRTYLEFFASGWRPSAAATADRAPTSPRRAAAGAAATLTGTLTGTGTLPLRFADPGTRRHAPRGQHPVYQTSNNVYGLKKASAVDMPDTYASSSQHFTSTFYGGPPKVSTMLTSITTSKVHKELDDF